MGGGKQASLAPLEEMQSPFGGWRHHLARWEACHWIRGSQSSPMNPVPLPPPLRGDTTTRAYCRDTYEENVSRCFILPPEQGWQGNTIRKEAKRPENRVTRFPVEKSGKAG